jgi:hypothetical protein
MKLKQQCQGLDYRNGRRCRRKATRSLRLHLDNECHGCNWIQIPLCSRCLHFIENREPIAFG